MILMVKAYLAVLLMLFAAWSFAASSSESAGSSSFDIAKATQAYVDTLGSEALQRSNAYFEGGYWLQLWNFLYGVTLAWLLLSTRLSSWMRNKATKISRFGLLRDALYLIQYFILTAILSFPLTIYQGYFREHAYGLSNLSLGGWMDEEIKGLLVGILFGTIAFTVIYAVIRRFPRSWVTLGSVVGIAFLVVMQVVAPVFISPIFNDYKSLNEGPVKAEILSLARANGIPVSDVYTFDASKQSTRISANVSGLLGTTRISLNDNLLNRSSPATIKAVMAHEMGHYVLNHSYTLLLSFGVILVIGFHFIRWGFDRLNRSSWEVKGVEDIAGFPLLMLLFSCYFFLLTPATNSLVRSIETEADLFGINASSEPEGFADGILSLSEYRKMKPGYWEEVLFYDHPSGYNRIYAAMRWRAENPVNQANSNDLKP